MADDLHPMWTASPDEVRERFLAFFREREHTEVASDSLVPENDPTLLFTGAGMNQFKDEFLGRVPLRFTRATTSQKCMRTGDLENVGRTPGHHTFFEMLGNFSFGDYFKEDAIRWAWEFLTVTCGVPQELLRVSVYLDDQEASEIWKRLTPIRDDRIARLPAKGNFWPANAPEAGPNGPCGPCSEIFFDLGEGVRFGDCTVEGCPEVPEAVDCDCRRFVEIWNLVFQQFDRVGVNELQPLGTCNIDTGMGYERILMVLAHLADGSPAKPAAERVIWNFQTPLFAPLVAAVHGLLDGRDLDAEELVKARRIADHVRAAVMCVADGVRPGNEGRGYVLRRILRRALRDGLQLGLDGPFLHELVPTVVTVMGGRYADLGENARILRDTIRQEEERFLETYEQGTRRLEKAVERLRSEGATELPGDEAFLLYDTFGFPVDIARDQLQEAGMTVDLDGFEAALEEARERSRAGSSMATDIFEAGPLERVKKAETGTEFLGYGGTPAGDDGAWPWQPGVAGRSAVVELLRGEEPVDALAAGEEGAVVLRATPFYAEQGGQVGDTGALVTDDGARFVVTDTRKVEDFHLHFGRMEAGALARGDEVDARVDVERRDAVRRNHTATHLLHRVLKSVLGDEVGQAGSLVAPDHLRFDFTFPRGLEDDEKLRIEDEVNRRILANATVETRVYTLEEARATGAVSMFGEKYGDRVRVLTAADSREFCGGTHCRATGDIGQFRITSERSVGSGVRRLEAVTGEGALRHARKEEERATALAAEVESLRKELAKAKKARPAAAAAAIDPLAAPRQAAGSLETAVIDADGVPGDALMKAGDKVKAHADGPLAVLLHAAEGGGVTLVVAASPAAVAAGFKAGEAIGRVAKAMGGGGGGRPDMARGKGRDPARLADGLAAFATYAGEAGGA